VVWVHHVSGKLTLCNLLQMQASGASIKISDRGDFIAGTSDSSIPSYFAP
jgi:hypothetical protein